MINKAGFTLALVAGFFSVFLLAWQGYSGAGADWVFGFLAVFWSLIMMLRLIVLTEPLEMREISGYLAQRIITSLRAKQEETRKAVLESAFGGSFTLFILAGFIFAAWQIYCAAFPAASPSLEGLNALFSGFFSQFTDSPQTGISFSQPRIFDWGQGFLLFLSFCMMGFVLRSHAAEMKLTRPILIVLAGYAVAGLIVCSGLGQTGQDMSFARADLVGNGAGSVSYLLSTLPAGKPLTLFDILLIESGVVGIGILTFALFIPLGYISLSAQQGRTDPVVMACGMLTGAAMILAVFLNFTPALAGFLALCAMGLFLAWGASETRSAAIEA